MNPQFIMPRYDDGGFAALPGTISRLFQGKASPGRFPGEYDNVVFCFIDGFGWRHFEKFSSHPFLDRFVRDGRVEKLTSQFPSTTSGHVTCIHTGLNVGQSGIFEWNYYEPLLDAMIVPLLFSFSGTTERDQLKSSGIAPEDIYPLNMFYKNLRALGVNAHIYQHLEYTPSTYSNILFSGANALGYKSLPEAMVNMTQALNQGKGKNYYFLYYDRIDSVSHNYGPASLQVEAEVDMFLHVMEKHIIQKRHFTGRTLFLMCADHGQAEIDPATTIYINRAFPDIEKVMRTNRKGGLLVPGGGCRDMFLYIKEDALAETQYRLAQGLEGKADVVLTDDLITSGYFGDHISDLFRARAGNLVILPYRYEAVWWYERGKFEQKYYGHHGGLTPQEMEIPLLALELQGS